MLKRIFHIMNASKRRQREVVQFLTAKYVKGFEIYRRMQNMYGTEIGVKIFVVEEDHMLLTML